MTHTTHTEKVALAMAWYDSGLENRDEFQTLIESLLVQPERHELQTKGEHPAPCARHCEANAFKIVIKNLKAQLAQPEQEPYSVQQAYAMAQVCLDLHEALGCKWGDNPYLTISQLKATPPQRTWVGLTEQDLDYLCNLAYTGDEEFALAVQAKLMEKNA